MLSVDGYIVEFEICMLNVCLVDRLSTVENACGFTNWANDRIRI